MTVLAVSLKLAFAQVFDPQSNAQEAFFFFHSDCRMCLCSPKMIFISYHIITLYSLRNILGCRIDLFSPHTGRTAGAIFNVLDYEFRYPALVEIRSKNIFYGHPFPSAVSIRAAISFLRKSGHSILIYYGTV